MELKELHWWKFDQELVEGCQIECPACLEWPTHREWMGKLAQCRSCGLKFLAMNCPECGAYVDHLHKVFRVKMPGEKPLPKAVTAENKIPSWKRPLFSKKKMKKREVKKGG